MAAVMAVAMGRLRNLDRKKRLAKIGEQVAATAAPIKVIPRMAPCWLTNRALGTSVKSG